MTRFTRHLGLALLLCLAVLALGGAAVRAQSDEGLELGARLYAENCAMCHGPNGEGRIGATLAKDWPAIRPDLTVRTIIENGVPGTAMPAWGQANGGPFSETEIDALMLHILSWQTGGPPAAPPSPTATLRPAITPVSRVEGDPNRGAVLFDENCAVCHGLEGEGRIGATLAKNWPAIWPDQVIKASIANGVPGTNMPAWSQAYGGPLDAGQIDDLVAFILTLSEISPAVQSSPTVIAPQTTGPSPFGGWAGVLVFAVLFILVVGVALLVQRRREA
jgi:mono/diheme cytochrome c family protein